MVEKGAVAVFVVDMVSGAERVGGGGQAVWMKWIITLPRVLRLPF